MKNKVHFIGIGAAKAGTTWLADNLRKHPEVFFPEEKELTYFNQTLLRMPGVKNPRALNGLDWYHSFFKAAASGQMWGEISVQYMAVAGTENHIYQYNPKAKIIALLRDPPKQVFSHFQYLRQRGVLKQEQLASAIEDRPDLLASTHYYRQLLPYFQLFPKENILVILFEDMIKNKKKYYHQVTEFLGLSEFYPEGLEAKSNETKAAKLGGLTYLIQNTRQFITRNGLEFIIPFLRAIGVVQLGTLIRDKWNVKKIDDKPKLDPVLEQEMRAFYLEDILALEKLIDRDLSHWKPKSH